MRDFAAVDRQLADLGPALERKQVAALLERLLGADRSLARLNELLDGMNGGTPSARPAPLRDPLAPAGHRTSPRPPAPAETRPRSDPPPSAPASLRPANPPGVRGALPPRIVSPLTPAQGDSLKTATPWPPVASPPAATTAKRSARDTLVDAPVPPPAIPQVDEQELDAETAALFGITTPPAAPVEAAPAPPEPEPEPEPLNPFAESSLPPPAAAQPAAEPSERKSNRVPTLQGVAGVDAFRPVEAAASSASPATAAVQTPAPRMTTRELLDQELDPREFPSSQPPRMRSIPPPLPSQRPAPQAAQDGFEMLIDDSEDDIMELDDMELEEID